jgi:hypothetical protein
MYTVAHRTLRADAPELRDLDPHCTDNLLCIHWPHCHHLQAHNPQDGSLAGIGGRRQTATTGHINYSSTSSMTHKRYIQPQLISELFRFH